MPIKLNLVSNISAILFKRDLLTLMVTIIKQLQKRMKIYIWVCTEEELFQKAHNRKKAKFQFQMQL